MDINQVNNGLIIQFGRARASNNRWFSFPIAFERFYSISTTSETPVGFDSYTCVTYVWTDSNLGGARVITTNQNTPGAHIIAIGI